MVQSNNGRADTVGAPLQLGDFLPERREVVINGQTYQAWVTTNNRYPRNIMARLDRAAREYNRVIAPIQDLVRAPQTDAIQQIANSPERQHALDEQPEAWDRYVTTCVLELIPSLPESEIELVSLPILEGLLRDLGYFQAPATTEVVTPSDPLIGGISAPDSPDSTPDTISTNS